MILVPKILGFALFVVSITYSVVGHARSEIDSQGRSFEHLVDEHFWYENLEEQIIYLEQEVAEKHFKIQLLVGLNFVNIMAIVCFFLLPFVRKKTKVNVHLIDQNLSKEEGAKPQNP